MSTTCSSGTLYSLAAERSRVVFLLVSLFGANIGAASASKSEPPPNRAEAGAGQSMYPLRLSLVWYDGYRYLSSYFGTMAREVERIFGEIGVEVVWRNGDDAPSHKDEPTRLLTLPLILQAGEPSAWGLDSSVMGATLGSRQASQAVYIFVPNVIRSLELDFDGGIESPKGGHRLARALGRIAAHEVVHAVAPTYPHMAEGLMERSLMPRFLVKYRVRLDPRVSRVFLSALRARLEHQQFTAGR